MTKMLTKEKIKPVEEVKTAEKVRELTENEKERLVEGTKQATKRELLKTKESNPTPSFFGKATIRSPAYKLLPLAAGASVSNKSKTKTKTKLKIVPKTQKVTGSFFNQQPHVGEIKGGHQLIMPRTVSVQNNLIQPKKLIAPKPLVITPQKPTKPISPIPSVPPIFGGGSAVAPGPIIGGGGGLTLPGGGFFGGGFFARPKRGNRELATDISGSLTKMIGGKLKKRSAPQLFSGLVRRYKKGNSGLF